MSWDRQLAEMIISDALERWPETAQVFHRHNMSCVGCAVAPFFTIADAATIYRLSLESFTLELEEAINGAGASDVHSEGRP